MSAIEFKNAKGQIRYQPAHPDGRRKWEGSAEWAKPYREEGGQITSMAAPLAKPALYRTKRRAYRQVSKLIVRENAAARDRFKEAE